MKNLRRISESLLLPHDHRQTTAPPESHHIVVSLSANGCPPPPFLLHPFGRSLGQFTESASLSLLLPSEPSPPLHRSIERFIVAPPAKKRLLLYIQNQIHWFTATSLLWLYVKEWLVVLQINRSSQSYSFVTLSWYQCTHTLSSRSLLRQTRFNVFFYVCMSPLRRPPPLHLH